MIVIDSMLLHRLGAGEQRVVVAHELGHILSDHVVYTSALNILLSVGGSMPLLFDLPFRAVRTVLLEWYRAAELSCDRAATLAVRDPEDRVPDADGDGDRNSSDRLDLDAFMTQALEYETWDDPSDRVRRFFNELGATHPYAVRRVSEVMKWVQSGEYDRILRGEYRTRDEQTDARAEAGDAMDFYAERFRASLRDLGDNVTSLGNQVGGMAEQAADWLRSRSGPSGAPGSSDSSDSEPPPGSGSPGGDVFGDELDDG